FVQTLLHLPGGLAEAFVGGGQLRGEAAETFGGFAQAVVELRAHHAQFAIHEGAHAQRDDQQHHGAGHPETVPAAAGRRRTRRGALAGTARRLTTATTRLVALPWRGLLFARRLT